MAAKIIVAANTRPAAGVITVAVGVTMATTMVQTGAIQSIKMLAATTKKSLAAIRKHTIAVLHIVTIHTLACAIMKIAAAGHIYKL